MTQHEIRQIALRQSAIDANCVAEDFEKSENVVVLSAPHPQARRYLELPFVCNLISYGTNIVASVDQRYIQDVQKYIDKYNKSHIEDCFETPYLHVLDDFFEKQGMRVCFMAEYWLPDVERLRPLDCGYPLRLLAQRDFAGLYLPEWSNALCKKRKELDVLGIGAYNGERLIGLAACSADCDGMWQIGVDVLPEYRRQGIASALTSRLALEILNRDRVPFYCCAWSNVKSARNAIKSGFSPAWVELTVKPKDFVDKMNG